MHVRRTAMAPFLSHNRGGEAEELWNGGAIINKLVTSIMNYIRDLRAKQEGHHVQYMILSITPFKYLIRRHCHQ